MSRHDRRRLAALNRGRRTGYRHRILALLESGSFIPAPGLHHAIIEHDPACAIYRGEGCCCVPDISLSSPDAVVTVDEHGRATRRVRS
jgi:hypothetical protein